ncbi:hypothetical protein LWI29_013370 [Acer saccharum]|uniref:CCHC-type domain-containing protein n=1 Tax=Acer saccharum TaxID=4024 RepID=A0AA39S1K1_ACESA|nr:hypothetical protein LWI29_013370 [Acer saccharum]
MSDFVREEIDSLEEMPLLLERFRRFVKLTTSPPKKKLTTSPPKKKKIIALETSKHDKKEGISIEDMGLNDKPNQGVSSREGIQCYECGGFGHLSPECGNLKDRRKGKALATLWDKYEDDENPSSDEELAIIYTEFGAKSVEVEEDGIVALTCNPQEELDIEVVGVATHRDLAHSSSRDKFDDLDEGDDSIVKTYHKKKKKKKTSRYKDRIYTIAFELSSRRCHVDEVVFDDALIGFSLEQSPNVGAFVVEHEKLTSKDVGPLNEASLWVEVELL